MKNLVFALIIFGIVGYFAKGVFEDFFGDESDLSSEDYSYPAKIKIKNKEGSEIKITLLGRDSNYFEFSRKDGKRFVYPIDSLCEKSRELVIKYPESDISEAARDNMELEDVYVVQLEEEIRRIEAEIERLNAKAAAATSRTESRTYSKKVEELNQEIAEIKVKIAERM